MIYLGADHRGFELKEKVANYLESIGEEFNDLGAFKYDKDDDYNEPAERVSKYTRLASSNRGIVFCGSGAGVSIVCNKHFRIRCATVVNSDMTEDARRDDNVNVIAIPSSYVSFEKVKKIVEVFLKTPFSFEERYVNRLKKLNALENIERMS